MVTILLIVIYIGFIGLGIPDSIFGTAWPAIYTDWNLPISTANLVTGLVTCGTFISSVFSAKLIKKLGTANIAFICTLLTAIAMLGYSLSPNIYWFCLFSLPYGIGAGSIDAALNNYVALHYSAAHMNYLHCFYGVGVSFSPYIMSLALSGESGWRGGYQWAFYCQFAIAVILILSLPIWKKCKKIHTCGESNEQQKILPYRELFKLKGIKSILLAFFASCSIEFVCGVWGSTYLVEDIGMKPQNAAKIIVIYYFGLALGRFLSGVFSSKISSMNLIKIGTIILAAAVLMLVLSCSVILSSSVLAAIGLFLVGFGNAPTYPNLMHLAPQTFGAELSSSVIGLQQASACLAIFLSPIVFGFIADGITVTLYPFFALFILIFLVFSVFFISKLKSR